MVQTAPHQRMLDNATNAFDPHARLQWFEAVASKKWADAERCLIEGGSIDAHDERKSERNTALHEAVECNNVASVQWLLAHGADPNVGNHHQQTPLHLAVLAPSENIVSGLEWEGLQALLDAGADPNRPDQNAWSPLWYVCHGGWGPRKIAAFKRVGLLRRLLNAGAVINPENDDDCRPLNTAARYGDSVEMVCELLAQGAVMVVEGDGTNILHDVVWSINGVHDDAIVEVLVNAGADVNAVRYDDGATPLHLAVEVGNVKVVRALLKNGANPDAVNLKGETPRAVVELFFKADPALTDALRACFRDDERIRLNGTVPVSAFPNPSIVSPHPRL